MARLEFAIAVKVVIEDFEIKLTVSFVLHVESNKRQVKKKAVKLSESICRNSETEYLVISSRFDYRNPGLTIIDVVLKPL